MKKIFLVLIICLTSSITFADSDDWSFGLSMGSTIPIGEYASSDIHNSNSGYAQTGFFLDASAFLKVNSSFSWVGKIRFTNNPIDNRSLYERAVMMSYPAMNLQLEDEDTDFEVNDWLSGTILAGGQYRWNIYESYFDVYATVGFRIWFLPEYEMSNPNVPNESNLTYVETYEKNGYLGFASLAGVAYNYPLKDYIWLRLSCDWIGSQVKNSYSQNYVPNTITPETPIQRLNEISYKSFNSEINIGIGLVYLF